MCVERKTKGRILCVENYPEICELIGDALSGYEVVSADSLRAAQLIIKDSLAFDLIISSRHLTDGNAADLARFLDAYQPKPPLLLLTSSAVGETELAQTEAAGVLHKKAHFIAELEKKVAALCA